jgi:hypothetical protein
MSQGEEAAGELEAAAAELIAFTEACGDEDWAAIVPGEGWTVAALVHHCAEGNLLALGWLRSMISGEGVSDTGADIDDRNARHAAEFAGASRAEAIELIRVNTATAAAALRSMSDGELERVAPFGPAGGAELPAGGLTVAFAQHVRTHLASAQAGLEAASPA